MAFCSNCGRELEEGAKFCASCGKPVESGEKQEQAAEVKADNQTQENSGNNPGAEFIGSAPQQAGGQSRQGAPQNTYTPPVNNDFSAKLGGYMKTDDKTGEFDPADISNNKVYALFSYLTILVLVPIIAAPNSKFARFHANQGLVLLIGEVIYGIFRTILMAVLRAVLGVNIYYYMNPIVSAIYNIISVVTGLLFLVFAIFAILGIIDAAQGKAKDLPLISKLKILK
mgnify:CR=1 FL=1